MKAMHSDLAMLPDLIHPNLQSQYLIQIQAFSQCSLLILLQIDFSKVKNLLIKHLFEVVFMEFLQIILLLL
jgi:hypothetical protein